MALKRSRCHELRFPEVFSALLLSVGERLVAVGEVSLTHLLTSMMPAVACHETVKRDLSSPDRVAAKPQLQAAVQQSMPAAIASTLVYGPWQKRVRTRIGSSRQMRESSPSRSPYRSCRDCRLSRLWDLRFFCALGQVGSLGSPGGFWFLAWGAVMLITSVLAITFCVCHPD